MLADESLFLPTMDLAIDFLRVGHTADYAFKGGSEPLVLNAHVIGDAQRRAVDTLAGRVLELTR